MAQQQLKGKKIAILAADMFERVELEEPLKALRDAGAEVEIVSIHDGEIQGFDGVNPADSATIKGDSKLKLEQRPPFSVGYVGINQAMPPMNNPLVRQAVAYAIPYDEIRKSVFQGFATPMDDAIAPAYPGYTPGAWRIRTNAREFEVEELKFGTMLKKSISTFPLKRAFPRRATGGASVSRPSRVRREWMVKEPSSWLWARGSSGESTQNGRCGPANIRFESTSTSARAIFPAVTRLIIRRTWSL